MRLFCKIMGGMHKITDLLNTEEALCFFCAIFGLSKIYAFYQFCKRMSSDNTSQVLTAHNK